MGHGVAAILGIVFDLAARQLRSLPGLTSLARRLTWRDGQHSVQSGHQYPPGHKPDSAGSFAHKLAPRLKWCVGEFYTSASTAVLTDMPFILVFVLMTYVVAGPLAMVLLIAVPVVLGMSFGVQSVCAA